MCEILRSVNKSDACHGFFEKWCGAFQSRYLSALPTGQIETEKDRNKKGLAGIMFQNGTGGYLFERICFGTLQEDGNIHLCGLL